MIELREPAKDDITHRAYALRLILSCEGGRDVEDRFRAKKELSGKSVGGPGPASASHHAELR